MESKLQTELKDGDHCKVVGGTHSGKAGVVRDINSSKTGHLTKIFNNLDHAKDREYQFDAIGRLSTAKGKATDQWTQQYTYDRYGNRVSVTASGTAADNSTMPTDGICGTPEQSEITSAGTPEIVGLTKSSIVIN